MLKYFCSFLASIIIFLVLALLKKNSNDIYWVKFWFTSMLIPMFLFFLFSTVLGKNTNGEKIIAFCFALFFLMCIIISLSEHNKIQENKIINVALFRKEKIININEIEKITFTFSTEPGGPILEIKTSFNTYSINSQIENIDNFLLKIKVCNNDITIVGNKYDGIIGLIALNLVTFIMTVYSFYLFFERIIELIL
jgi:hypothetical protein